MDKWPPLRRVAQNTKPTSPIYLQVNTNKILLAELKDIKKRLNKIEKKIGISDGEK